jgi:SAM-dependent methyltransferase
MSLHPELERWLDGFNRDCRVLDFGCGNGEVVALLRAQGWDAWGTDIALPYQHSERISLIESGRSKFPDGWFDLVISQEVFEHVTDISSVARELWRITKPGGSGLHVFPAQLRVIEPHIFMPFVHWLPKNQLRKWAVALCIRLGVGLTSDINRAAIAGMTRREVVDFEFRYLCDHTFYRQVGAITRQFRKQGFLVGLPVDRHRKLQGHPLLARLLRWPLLTFVTVHLELQRPA